MDTDECMIADDDEEEPFEDEKDDRRRRTPSSIRPDSPVNWPTEGVSDSSQNRCRHHGGTIAEHAAAPTTHHYLQTEIRMRASDAPHHYHIHTTSPRLIFPEAGGDAASEESLFVDEIVEAMMEIAPTTLEGVDQRVTELDTTVKAED
ncbi:hypothetical protein Tco_0287082 [Tanacetum coccineum]